ncbi:PglZ domain-containing protein [Chloroflexota bacterium]
MKTIKEYIQHDVLLPRLKKHGVLVVYDSERRYRELCLELASAKVNVVDASESSILSRAAALQALQVFGQPNSPLEGILVYVPAAAPRTDEDKQRDPFAVYSAAGGFFPESDADEYQNLCLMARADYATEIRRIFNANQNPDFDVVDAIGGGNQWPHLQALLRVDSARDILFALLAPSEVQKEALKGNAAWVGECHALLKTTLNLTLKTKGKSWSAIADELWRYLLFSEFVFDLPVELPSSLVNIPRAPREANHLIEDLCERLRNDRRTQPAYIERAEAVQEEMKLVAACASIEDLGTRDTFPFEERSFFTQAVSALQRDNFDKVREVLKRHTYSVWTGRGENQVQWALVKSAFELVQKCDDVDAQLTDNSRSMEALVNYYVTTLREVDRLQREFEQSVGDALVVENHVDGVTRHARAAYRKLAEKVHAIFIRHLEKSSWPLAGRLSNADTFDKFVAPKLAESGRRVAVFLIDALRYELGVELSKDLGDEGQAEVQVACAQLPTVTPVGMASLLPGAGQGLHFTRKDNKLAVHLEDQALGSVTQRMDVLRKRYGQRFAEMDLAKFASDNAKINQTVELLVLRTNEMDQEFESNPEVAPSLISRTFQRVRGALRKLANLGFQDAVIATDHGFFLNQSLEAGDTCAKPAGNWVNIHERMLVGDGSGDAANKVMNKEALGIRADFNQIAIPRALVAYQSGMTYFHGGISLQEALVPVISVRIHAQEKKVSSQFTVTLNYKRDRKKITTRLPVVEVAVSGQGNLFGATEQAVDVLLEAHDAKGNIVGEVKLGGIVNASTGVVSLLAGQSAPVTIKMNLEFEGKFSIKALDPVTARELGKSLDLETDYTV